LRYIPKKKIHYTGIIADLAMHAKNHADYIDYLVIISGPEPQRTMFEQIIFDQIANLEGRIVGALGIPEKNYKIRIGGAIFFSYISRNEMMTYMRKAKFIITRPGYTSVMEMVELGKRGLFVPTPGQIEQEYLARHFMEKRWCFSTKQEGIDLRESVKKAESYSGFPNTFAQTRGNLNNLFAYLDSGEGFSSDGVS